MPVKIRLTRMGKKKQPTYRVVVVDSRRPRDGKYIEQIGRYDPRAEPSLIEIDNEKAVDWLSKGAQPTETARKLLEASGAWTTFRVASGDIHTVATAPAAPQPVAEHTPEIHVVGEDSTAEETNEVPAAEEADAAEPQAAASDDTGDSTPAEGSDEEATS